MHQSESSSPQIPASQLQQYSQTEIKTNDFVPPQHKYIECQKFTSAFYRDNNEEQYAIQRAFQGNNFNYLRKLPTNFGRNCVLEQRMERAKGQIESQTVKRLEDSAEKETNRKKKIAQLQKQKIGTLGYFEIFPYQESDYQLPKKLQKMERVQKTKKREEISQLDFRPNGFNKKMKYQDPFLYSDRLDSNTNPKQPYLFPFHLPDDVYDAFHQSTVREQQVCNELKLAGDFIPSKTGHALRTVTKSKMPEIISEIEFYIKKYLKNVGYFIGLNKRDHIEVVFEGKHAHETRVQLGMSGMLEHQMLSKYILRKKLDHWGIINKKTDYLQYVILPQWVKDEESVKLRH